MKDLLKPCQKMYTKPFDESLAKTFILERFSDTEMVRSDETISRIIKTAGYIPGLMSMPFESLDDLQENVKECILDEWESIFDQIPGDKWLSDENLKLFVADTNVLCGFATIYCI